MGLYRNYSRHVDIAEISRVMQPATEAWFNATIQIVKPDITGGAFDRATNTKVRNPVTIYEGKARIQAMRWPNVATARQEAVSSRTVVFHIPLSATIDGGVIHEGWRIRVVDGGTTDMFDGGLFVITSEVNSSYAWDRRIETIQDQGTTVT